MTLNTWDMARFDVVEAASSGYRYVWKERRDLVQIAATPFLAKVGTLAAIALLGLNNNLLRQGLLNIPADFMEGFLVVIAIRMAIFGENYTRLLGGDGAEKIDEGRRRAIMGAVVIYVLSKLVSSFFSGTVWEAQAIEQSGALPPPSGSPYMMSFLVLLFIIWMFRFFWLYVPVAMNMRPSDFLQRIKAFSTSFYILAMWLFCAIPLTAVLGGVVKLLLMLFPEGANGSLLFILLVTPLRAAIELAIATLSGLAMAFALRDIIEGKKPKGLFW